MSSAVFFFFLNSNKTWHHRAEGKGRGKATESRQDRRRAKWERENKEQSGGVEAGEAKCVKMRAAKIS